MLVLILGLLIFLGAHVFATLRPQRAALIETFGEKGWKTGFSIVSGVGLVLIVWGFAVYRSDGLIHVWTPPVWARHLALPLVWLAFVALVSRRTGPGRIRGMLHHPMLVAIKLWAAAHLLANGDLGALLLFGSFLAFAVYDRIAVKKRGDAGAETSADFTAGDGKAVAIGTVVFAVVLALHPWLFGASPLR